MVLASAVAFIGGFMLGRYHEGMVQRANNSGMVWVCLKGEVYHAEGTCSALQRSKPKALRACSKCI